MDLYSAMIAKNLVKSDLKSLIVEKGTWTPHFYQVQYSQPLPTLTYSVQNGFYYRIGSFCYLLFNLTANITGTADAYLSVSGFPFVAKGSKSSILQFFSGLKVIGDVSQVSVARISDYAIYLLFPDQGGSGKNAFAKFPTGNITLQYSGCYVIHEMYGEYEEN